MILEDNFPTTIDGWRQELEHRLRLSSGSESPIGPNLQAIIGVMAELLHASKSLHLELSTKLYHKNRPTLVFTDGEWWTVSGRGLIFSTKMPETYEGNLIMEEVFIQGKRYIVLGVERFQVNDTTLYKGRPVGLVVREVYSYDHGNGD